jgi:PAS domain S-box-containing protein
MPNQPFYAPSGEFLDAALPFDLAQLFDDLLHELYIFDRESLRFLVVNRTARENLGYSSEEFHQMTPWNLKLDYTRERFEDLIAPLREAREKRICFETFHTRKDGTRYPVEVHLQMGGWGGRPVYVAMVLDTSERIQSQEALRLSERRLRTIFEQAGVGVALIHTESSAYVRVNQRYCEIVGRTQQELMGGITFKDLTHPDDLARQSVADGTDGTRSEIADFTMEKRFIHKDGSWVWASLTISPAWEKEDFHRQHIAIIQDITQSKKAREELHQKSTLLKNILDSSEDLIFVKDCNLRNVLSNRSFAANHRKGTRRDRRDDRRRSGMGCPVYCRAILRSASEATRKTIEKRCQENASTTPMIPHLCAERCGSLIPKNFPCSTKKTRSSVYWGSRVM